MWYVAYPLHGHNRIADTYIFSAQRTSPSYIASNGEDLPPRLGEGNLPQF